MKYICAEDFFRQAASAKRLSREEEKEYALRMKAGDREAGQLLTDSYLPVLAAYLKQHVRQPSLQLVYLGLQTLESAVSTFDFQSECPTFSHELAGRVKRAVARYIADSTL